MLFSAEEFIRTEGSDNVALSLAAPLWGPLCVRNWQKLLHGHLLTTLLYQDVYSWWPKSLLISILISICRRCRWWLTSCKTRTPSLRCNERFPDQRSTSEGITGSSPVTGWHRPVIRYCRVRPDTPYILPPAVTERGNVIFSSGVRNQLRLLFSRLFIDVSVTVVCWRTCLSPLFQSNRGVE